MEDATDRAEQQILVTKLITGKATQEERDRALATVLLSLWGQKELKDLIRMVHNEECAKCPLKHSIVPADATDGDGEGNKDFWKHVITSLLQYGGWLILIIAGLLKISVK